MGDEGLNVGDDSGSEEPQECWFHVSFTTVRSPLLICVELRQLYSFQWVARATLDLKQQCLLQIKRGIELIWCCR